MHCTLDILFCQIRMFIKVWVAFVFRLQTLWAIDFTKILQWKGLKPKSKGHTNFYESCDLTKKVNLLYIKDKRVLPAKWVTEEAFGSKLAVLLRRGSLSEDCLVKCRPRPRPWWKRPSASTSWRDLRWIDEDIMGPLDPTIPTLVPWWSAWRKKS